MKNLNLIILFLIIPLSLFSQYTLIEPELVTKLTDTTFNEDRSIHYYKGKFYFSQYTKENDVELWSTDGTQDGTKQFIDLNSSIGSYPGIFENRLDRLIFFANGEKHRGLWSTNGTKEDTYFIDSIYPMSRTQYMKNYIIENELINNKVFFIGMRHPFMPEPWVSDGTKEGTFMLKDINKSGGIHCNYIFKLENRIVFLADLIDSTKSELWSTDGTIEGTYKLLDFYHYYQKYKEESSPIENYVFSELNGKLLFSNRKDGYGNCIWVTDGTKEGTELITDTTQKESGYIYLNAIVNEKSYFITRDSSGTHSLWISDGTKGNTKKTMDLLEDDEYNDEFYNRIQYLVPMEDKLAIAHVHRDLLWFTDGYTLSKFEYQLGYHHQRLKDVIPINGGVMFRESKKQLYWPWISDGTADGTFKIEGFEYGFDESAFLEYELVYNNVCIVQALKDKLRSLMKIDINTKEVSTLISHIDEGFDTSFQFGELIDSVLFFRAYVFNLKKYIRYSQLWRMDPVDNNLALIAPNIDERIETYHDLGSIMKKGDDDYLYFYANYESIGPAIWRIRGTQTSVKESEKTELMTVYPNPANGYIQIAFDFPMELRITSSTGAVVKNCGIVTDGKVNVSELSTGVYFVVDEQGNSISKFVKE